MTTSPTITKISPALILAQTAIGSAKKGSENPFFHSKYADLGAVMEACKQALNENGICVIQPVEGDKVFTRLLHSSGEWIEDGGTLIIFAKPDPQAQGSAITYARRYGLQSLLFIPAEDDDGERATNHAQLPEPPLKKAIATARQYAASTPENDVFVRQQVGNGTCPHCGAKMVRNPKTDKWFCEDKCWLNPPPLTNAKAIVHPSEAGADQAAEDYMASLTN